MRHSEQQRLVGQSYRYRTACVVPEAYASKWFIGLCVHVLPFEALLAYVEAFLEEGFPFLFKFSLALVTALAVGAQARTARPMRLVSEKRPSCAAARATRLRHRSSP